MALTDVVSVTVVFSTSSVFSVSSNMQSRALVVLCLALAIWSGAERSFFVAANDGPADEIQVRTSALRAL